MIGTEVGSFVGGNTNTPTDYERLLDNDANLGPAKYAVTSNNANKKYRGWCFTINNITQEFHDNFYKDCYVNKIKFEYIMWQVEKVSTIHMQGFVYFKNPRAFGGIKPYFHSAHLEPMKGSIEQNVAYCSKTESRVAGPFEFGERPKQGRRTDLEEIAKVAMQPGGLDVIKSENPSYYIRYHRGLQLLAEESQPHRTTKPTVTWLWGLAGAGKTKYVFDLYNANDIYVKDGTQWWDGYRHQKVILIDDFDGKWPFRDFLRLLDHYQYQGQIKGGYVKINSEHIYITCEWEPEHFWSDCGLVTDRGQAPINNTLNQVLRRIDLIKLIKPDVYKVKLPVREY